MIPWQSREELTRKITSLEVLLNVAGINATAVPNSDISEKSPRYSEESAQPVNRLSPLSEEEQVTKAILPKRTPTVLLVDDDELVRGFISAALHQLGYEVFEAAHGEEGIRQYNAHSAEIDVIVSDVLMPKLTGPEMIRKLQERGMSFTTRVLFVTGYSDTFLPPHFAEDFPGSRRLDKPFTVEALSRNVKDLLPQED